MNQNIDLFGEGERRQATIMFADLSGFTSLSEIMDPEDLTSIVNECLTIMGRCIEKNEGTIDKFIGDCVMAVFGVPVSIENAPLKAVNAAIEIRKGITRFIKQKNLDHPLDIHIGINTGMVIAGPVGTKGSRDNTVMGDAVNVASRLKDISSAGQIFVGKRTYTSTREIFDYQPIDPVSVRGKERPLEVFELLSREEKSTPALRHADRMVHSAMVGRQKEMDKLSLNLLRLINGEGSIVNIVGEAGLGKSRLMAELREKEEMGRIMLLEGRAISSGRNLSFYPIIDLLKKWAAISDEDPDRIAQAKLEKTIQRVAADKTNEIYPFIAVFMGMKLSGNHLQRIKDIEGEALEKLILKNLDHLLIKLSALQPLMIVMEDLHWADLTSVELLESLFRLSGTHSILFVNVFRPGYKDTSERILRTMEKRYTDQHINIQIQPLTGEDCEHLIKNLLRIKGFPLEVKDQIINRTSGNPFFIEEIIRSFIDDGVILIKNNKFEVTHKIDSVVIPSSVSEVIMSRIDRLDEDARSLLKIASVIGRSFYYKILQQMLEMNGDLDKRLAFMEEIQLISRQEKKEEVAYIFKHALAQEATYESILLKKRRELHLKTAQTIEKIFPEKISDFYGILAWHYGKAENYAKAEEYLLKSGEEALRTSASNEAINYFKEALYLYRNRLGEEASHDQIAKIEENIGIALVNKGQFSEALFYLDNVLTHYGIQIRANQRVTLYTIADSLIQLMIGLYIPALKWRKVPTASENNLNKLMFYHLNCFGFVEPERLAFVSFQFIKRMTSFNLERSDGGIENFILSTYIFSYAGLSFKLHHKILSFLRDKIRMDRTNEKISYATSRCMNIRMEGNYGSHYFDEELVEECFYKGNLSTTSYYIIFSFFIELGQGNFDAAQHQIERLEKMQELFDNYSVDGWVYLAKSKLFTKQRKLNRALDQIELFIEFCRSTDDQTQLLWAYASKAYIQILKGDIQGAEHSLEHIQAEEGKSIIYVFKTTLMLSRLCVSLYYFEKAIQEGEDSKRSYWTTDSNKYCKESIRVAKKIADDRIEIYKLAGNYYWLRGKQKKALHWWGRSIREGEKMGALPELARAYSEIGKRLSENGSRYQQINGLSIESCFDKALKLFRKLDFEEEHSLLEKIVDTRAI